MENVEKGLIFNVQRYQVHDGPGIRTIVFLKGCPCGCLWCSNPEGQNRNPELFFIKSKCNLCGKCIDLCPQHANAIIDNNMIVDRQICQNCGKCVDICPHSAREIKGVYKSITEIINEIEKDRSFYFISGGGVTIAGGEPLSQPEFSRNLMKKCKSLGIQTAIETSGYGSWVDLERIIPHLDWIFYDVKLLNNQNHKKYTGVYNSLILDNAVKLSQALENTGGHFTIRIPVIPGINNNKKNIRAIVEFFKRI